MAICPLEGKEFGSPMNPAGQIHIRVNYEVNYPFR
jgi:hypothetical protein